MMTVAYTVDQKRLTIKEMAVLQRYARTGTIDVDGILPILNSIVVTEDGSKAEDLPYEHMVLILEALSNRMTNPNPT